MEQQTSVRDVRTENSSSISSEDSTQNKEHHQHGASCCSGHHHHHHHRHARRAGVKSGQTSIFASILPVLACALCPACLGIWAQVFSFVGLGVIVTEAQHHVLLGVALGIAFVTGALAFVRTRFIGPFALTSVGCTLVAASHFFAEENVALSWLSIAVLLGASLWQRRKARSALPQELTPLPNSTFASRSREAT